MLTASEIKGYKGLQKYIGATEVFEKFLQNFYNAQGLETRETIKPVSVRVVNNKSEGMYIRFDYTIKEREEWLHVTSPGTWY